MLILVWILAVAMLDPTSFRAPQSARNLGGVSSPRPDSSPSSRLGMTLALAMRAFHGQRCGTAVDLGSGYEHRACHLDSPPIGGWHDAGDYGRYVVNAGITTGTLLWTWELFRETAPAELLDEVKWELDWLLQMQKSDGSVAHKQTSDVFPDFVMPQDDKLPIRMIGVSSCATADFAAVMAIAGRVYDGPFAERAIAAANRAWTWLDAHPNVTFRNPPSVKTGEYGDSDCSDERLWAGAELWRTTGEASAHAYFLKHWRARVSMPPDWKHVGALALWTYALAGNGDARVTAAIRDRVLDDGVAMVKRARLHPYRIPMREKDFVWGSNAVAANYGVALLVAHRLRPNRAYIDATRDIVEYLLGRNPYGLSFVTGTGERSVQHPHHRPSAADGIAAPWPGLLAGGPNRNAQDPVLRRLSVMYVDDQESYASNEVAINWNAPLLFILTGLLAEDKQ